MLKSQPLVPQNVNLFGTKVIVDVIIEMSPSKKSGLLSQYNWWPYEKRRDLETDTQETKLCDHKDKDWSDASMSQEMLKIADKQQKLIEARRYSSLETSERIQFCQHLESRLLVSRTTRQRFLLLYPLYGTLLQQPYDTNTYG